MTVQTKGVKAGGCSSQMNFQLPGRHVGALVELSEDAENRDKTLADLIAGAVESDHSNTINLWFFRLINRKIIKSYRAKEALRATYEIEKHSDAEWVTFNAKTRLRYLLDKYGDRLLGYDSNHVSWTVEVLAWDVVDSSARTVRVLIKNER